MIRSDKFWKLTVRFPSMISQHNFIPPFRLWVIDDYQKGDLHNALERALGPADNQEALAEWKIIPAATWAVERMRTGEWPHVALIDLNFVNQEAQEKPSVVGSIAASRGFKVASALRHYSNGRARFILYTGNEKAQAFYRDFIELPHGLSNVGVEPLFEVRDKASEDTWLDVVGWLHSETTVLARQCLQYSGLPSSAIGPTLCDLLGRTRELVAGIRAVQALYDRLLDAEHMYRELDEDECIRAGFKPKWSALTKGRNDLGDDPLRAIDALADFFSYRDVEAWTASGSTGKWLADLWSNEFQVCLNSLPNLREELKRKERAFADRLQGELTTQWYGWMRRYVPFEARGLESYDGFTSTAGVAGALETIIRLVEDVDSNFTLARVIKDLKVGSRRRPTTIMAHACHGWDHADVWPYPNLPYKPVDTTMEERYLEIELGEKPFDPAADDAALGAIVPVLLPQTTICRIKSQGEVLNRKTPLVAFSRNKKGYENDFWTPVPHEWFGKHYGYAAITSSGTADRLLTDWFYLFDPENGLCARIGEELKTPPAERADIKSIHVSYAADGANGENDLITVRYDIDKHETFFRMPSRRDPGRIERQHAGDGTGGGGNLMDLLLQFRTWAKVTVLTNDEANVIRHPLFGDYAPISMEQDTTQKKSDEKLFALELSIRNYVRLRSPKN
jgi:hypothetical protein